MSAPGNPANCLVLAADNSVHALKLASEAQSGLKIPSGQIAGGKFTIAPGETKDLDIDFDACASIAPSGGQFILKPVLHAGEVGLSSAINGTVIDNSTSQPILGGTTVVALEQVDNDLRTVQQWLGHSDMESTMRYLKPSRSQQVREKVNEIFA